MLPHPTVARWRSAGRFCAMRDSMISPQFRRARRDSALRSAQVRYDTLSARNTLPPRPSRCGRVKWPHLAGA